MLGKHRGVEPIDQTAQVARGRDNRRANVLDLVRGLFQLDRQLGQVMVQLKESRGEDLPGLVVELAGEALTILLEESQEGVPFRIRRGMKAQASSLLPSW